MVFKRKAGFSGCNMSSAFMCSKRAHPGAERFGVSERFDMLENQNSDFLADIFDILRALDHAADCSMDQSFLRKKEPFKSFAVTGESFSY